MTQTLEVTETPALTRRQQMKPKTAKKAHSAAFLELNSDEIVSISLRRRELANKLEDARQALGRLKAKISALATSLSNPDAKVEGEMSQLRERLRAIALEEAAAQDALQAFDESHLSEDQLRHRAGEIEKQRQRDAREAARQPFLENRRQAVELLQKLMDLDATASQLVISAPANTWRDGREAAKFANLLGEWHDYVRNAGGMSGVRISMAKV
jgi:seryl-tRNA synthetase